MVLKKIEDPPGQPSESSAHLQRHADCSVHAERENSVKTANNDKGEDKAVDGAAVREPASGSSETKIQRNIRLAKEKGFKILKLVIDFPQGGPISKQGMIRPVEDDCKDISRSVMRTVMSACIDFMLYFPKHDWEYRLKTAYRAPDDDCYAGELSVFLKITSKDGTGYLSGPVMDSIWMRLSRAWFFYSPDKLMAALNPKTQYAHMDPQQPPNSESARPVPLPIRGALSTPTRSHQPPAVPGEHKYSQPTDRQPPRTARGPANTERADAGSAKASTSNTDPETHGIAKRCHHPPRPTGSSAQQPPAAAPQPQASSMPAAELLYRCERELNPQRSAVLPLPNWYWDTDDDSRVYFYNDAIDVAIYGDPRGLAEPHRRECVVDRVCGDVGWQEHEAADGATWWVHADGVWCLEPPWMSTEEAKRGAAQRVLRGGLSNTKRRGMVESGGAVAPDVW